MNWSGDFGPPLTLPTSSWTLHDLYRRIEMPCVPMLQRMMATGLQIDRPYMQALSEQYATRMEEHTNAAADILGVGAATLNLASGDQVAQALYGQLGVRAPKTTKGGKRGSTDSEAMDRLQETINPDSRAGKFITECMAYDELDKLKDSFCDKALALADRSDRIYTTLKQTKMVSGRIASAEPFNFTALPVHSDESKIFKRAFIPRPGYRYLALDLSQIEMVVTAHASQDPGMMMAFILGQDLHTQTASEMFGIPMDKVDKDKHRYPAKTVGFGSLYGLTERGLMVKLPRENRTMAFASDFMKRYWDARPLVAKLVEQTKTFVRRHGWVADLLGRVRWIPEVASAIERIRAEGEREAFSHIIQGTASGIFKLSLGHTLPLLERYHFDAHPFIAIHDAIDLEVREGQEMDLAECLGEEYVNSVRLDIPMRAEIETGDNWGEMETILKVVSRG